MTPEQLREPAKGAPLLASPAEHAQHAGATAHSGLVTAAWLAVWIPIGWGVWVTLERAVALFR
jgi:hypothetical protein